MIKTGIYYAYWTSDWDADFIPYIKKAASLGFDVLEINAGTIASMHKASRMELRAAAESQGIEMSCCVGLPPAEDPSADEKSVRRAGVKKLNEIADAMKDCGIEKLSGIIYSCWPAKLTDREGSKESARAYAVESMAEAAKKAEDLGLQYNLEVVNRFEQFLLNTAREAVDFIIEIGSPALKILLDTFHMNIEENSMSEAVKTAGSLLGHFHLGENNRRPPGTGSFNWSGIFSDLKSVNFDGWAVMEPFLSPGGEVGRDISVYRDMMPGADPDEEAAKSCSFIKQIISRT